MVNNNRGDVLPRTDCLGGYFTKWARTYFGMSAVSPAGRAENTCVFPLLIERPEDIVMLREFSKVHAHAAVGWVCVGRTQLLDKTLAAQCSEPLHVHSHCGEAFRTFRENCR